jgi:hypothetical protein
MTSLVAGLFIAKTKYAVQTPGFGLIDGDWYGAFCSPFASPLRKMGAIACAQGNYVVIFPQRCRCL